MLAINFKLKWDNFSPEKLFLGLSILLPMLFLVLLSSEQYIGIAALLVVIFLILIIQNYQYGLYFIVIGLPLFQSISTKSDAATSTGIHLQYILIPVVFVAWFSEKLAKKELPSIRLPYFGLMILFTTAMVFSILNQVDVVGSQLWRQAAINIYAFVNYLLLFYILINEKFSDEQINKLLWSLLIVAFLTAVIGIFQYFTMYTGPGSGFRATSTFGSFLRTDTKNNPNAFGTYLAFVTVLALWVWNITKKKNRFYLIVMITAFVVALLLSMSRSSLLALIFSILCYTFYKNKRIFLITMFISMAGVIVLYFEPAFQRRIQSIFAIISDKRVINLFLNINPQTLDWSYVEYFGIQGYNSDIISGAFRIWAWIQGIQLFVAHPFLGIGYGLNLAFSPWPTSENLYLDFACMTGLVGFSFFLVIQYFFIRDGFRLLRIPKLTHIGMFWLNVLAILFIVSLTGSILFNGKLLGIFWILAGVFYNVKQKKNDSLSQ
jgi:hypothetical protein